MRSRKFKTIVIAAAVAAVLLVGAVGAMLYHRIVQFADAEKELRTAKNELARLYDRDPFPTAENKQLEDEHYRALQEEFATFLDALGQGQVEPEKTTPSRFMGMFWETRKDLLAQAKLNGIAIADPENFMFGFRAYQRGNVPKPEDIPRLTQQVGIVTNLCAILYDGRITELTGFLRDEFDQASAKGENVAPSPSHRPGVPSSAPGAGKASDAGLLKPDDLFARFHFVLEFKASEAAVLQILNEMASAPLFMAVTSLQLMTDQTGVMHIAKPVLGEEAPKAEPAASKTAPGEPDRIVAGREKPMSVILGVDVYEFRKKAQ